MGQLNQGTADPSQPCRDLFSDDPQVWRDVTAGTVLENILPDLYPCVLYYTRRRVGKIKESYKHLFRFGFDPQNPFAGPYDRTAAAKELGRLIHPWAMVFDDDGNFYVAEHLNGRAQKFNRDRVPIKVFGTVPALEVDKNGILGESYPIGMTILRNGNIAVSDYSYHRIRIFTSDGEHVKTFGENGKGPLQFCSPYDLATDLDGNIVCGDAYNFRLQIISPEGQYIRSIPVPGSTPCGVAIDPQGNYVIADNSGMCIIVLDPTGKQILRFGQCGSEPGQFSNLLSVEVDREGHFIIPDFGNLRVQIFDPTGKLLQVLGSRLTPAEMPEAFRSPLAVRLDANGNLWVSEQTSITVWG